MGRSKGEDMGSMAAPCGRRGMQGHVPAVQGPRCGLHPTRGTHHDKPLPILDELHLALWNGKEMSDVTTYVWQ